MEKTKLKLDFVNEGKEFNVTNWTTQKHENALDNLAAYQKAHKVSDKVLNNEFKYFVIYESLVEVDENVDIEKIRHMHPIDLIDLFNVIYNAGRKGIYAQDFRKPTPKQKE